MNRAERARKRVAYRLNTARCEPSIAADVIVGARLLYTGCQRIRRAGLPQEALQIVNEIEASTIQFGTWLKQFLPDDAKLGE